MFEILKDLFVYFEGNVILMGLCAFLGAIATKRIETKETTKLKELVDSKLSVLAAQNEPVVHINREQAEFEFSRYRKIWEATSEISSLMSSAIKRVNDPEKLYLTFQTLHEMRCDLGALTNNVYPFIDNEVYESALACHKSSFKLMQLLATGDSIKSTDQLAEVAKREFDQISVNYHYHSNKLAQAIKLRLDSMSALETQP